jgi:peptidoglycan hydrolase-like protein with peptidoglycan-binding domain
MSTARSFFLVSVGIALGIAGATIANSDIDFSQHIDAFRSADRGAGPAAPAEIPMPPPRAAAPSPRAVDPAPETVVVTLPSANAPAASQRTHLGTGNHLSLAQQLQSELQRVGCYAGNIDGVWTPSSQKAMKAFTERVNARLPVDEPDYVLLALVRGRQGKVCMTACPPDQTLAADNRCVPDAVLARAAKPAPQRAAAALTRSPAEARMIPAGPDNGTSAAAGIAQAPEQPGAVPPMPQQKLKAAAKRPSPGPFGTDIFKLLISGY